ncbi:hypothetical protein [Kaistella sp.]|uniref:hypothetical protein n=1 Tax=Kaistella sp. TaxID=2782235 RepID=UPI003C31BD90
MKSLTIVIDNQGNPELEIKKVSLIQNPISILADLKSNESYTFKIDQKFPVPTYDLAQSGINFNRNYPIVTFSDLELIHNNESIAAKSFWQTSLFMWICIVLAVFRIGYFALTMIKDMNKETKFYFSTLFV